MRIGKRLFPYPVLNSQTVLNLYHNSTFSFVCDLNQEDEYFILENTHYINNNDTIQNLIDEGKVTVVCIVECSSTIYRETFKITDVPTRI